MIRRILEFIRNLFSGRSQRDLESIMEEMARKNAEKLDWRNSVVDLMKLNGMNSSLENRKRLAQQLGYSGKADGSAAMNIWLHKKLMDELR